MLTPELTIDFPTRNERDLAARSTHKQALAKRAEAVIDAVIASDQADSGDESDSPHRSNSPPLFNPGRYHVSDPLSQIRRMYPKTPPNSPVLRTFPLPVLSRSRPHPPPPPNSLVSEHGDSTPSDSPSSSPRGRLTKEEMEKELRRNLEKPTPMDAHLGTKGARSLYLLRKAKSLPPKPRKE